MASPEKLHAGRWGVGYVLSALVIVAAIGVIVLIDRNGQKGNTSNPTPPTDSSAPVNGSSASGMGTVEVRSTRAALPAKGESTPSAPRPSSEVGKLIEEYDAQAASLRRDVAAYRDSIPCLKEFREVFRDYAVPTALENLPAVDELQYKHGISQTARSNYGPEWKTLKGDIKGAVLASYGEIPKIAFDLFQSGKLRSPDGNTTRTLESFKMVMADYGKIPAGTRISNPFLEGTTQSLVFQRDVCLQTLSVTRFLHSVLFALPPDLAEREQELRKLEEEIRQKIPAWGQMGKKYIDPDEAMMDDFQRTIDTISDERASREHIRQLREKLLQQKK